MTLFRPQPYDSMPMSVLEAGPVILPKPEPKPRVRKRIPRGRPPAKKRKTTLAAAKRKLWDLFSAYVKERDGNVCFTCDKPNLSGWDWHAGHMLPGRGGAVLFHPELVHPQCFRCNINLKGNVGEYSLRYMERFGEEKFKAHVLGARSLRQWSLFEILQLTEAIKRSGADFELMYSEFEQTWKRYDAMERYCSVCYHPVRKHHETADDEGCMAEDCDCPAIPAKPEAVLAKLREEEQCR